MSNLLYEFVGYITQKRINLHNVTVHQHGELLDKFNWLDTDRRTDIHSASKSITSLAAGIAIDEGLFDLDTRPVDVLAGHLPDQIPEHLEKVTVRNLLSMSFGHDHPLMPGYSRVPGVPTRDELEDTDWIHYAFSQPIAAAPGTTFMYDNSCPYLISAMIQELTGETMLNWLKPRLFEPMNIRNPQWLTDPQGRSVGAGGLQLTCEELSRFGILCLNKGNWKGQQLISEAYMKEATSRQIDCPIARSSAPRPDGLQVRHDYGYFFWRFDREDIYYLSGWAGQGCLIAPELDACVTFKAYEFNGAAILASIYDYVLPKLRPDYDGVLGVKKQPRSRNGVVSPWG